MKPARVPDGARPSRDTVISVELQNGHDFEEWREVARQLVASNVPPDRTIWMSANEGERDLFASTIQTVPPSAPARPVRATKSFLQRASRAVMHRSNRRLPLLYRVLWRLQSDPHLLEKTSDPDVLQLAQLDREVRRDIHKMRAFVRFQLARDLDGTDRYVAWFEPDHAIVKANADFFLNRFAGQRWSILTPQLSLHWDGSQLATSPGVQRGSGPSEDGTEALWQTYYASTFNPARLKISTMVKEMPRRYWKNLPEARLIPGLIASAQAREATMVSAGGDPFQQSAPTSLEEIARRISTCTACPIGCNGTRAVAGEGPDNAQLMIVGEQPGDHEEQQGHPFVGPAGQLLDKQLALAELDRSQIRMTNAVKHFKFERSGKRRLHQNPTAGEIDRCRWWLDAERRIVRPAVILAMGASAGRAILGRTPSIARDRGVPFPLPDGSQLWLTAHPSYVLRLSGEAREREQRLLERDLAALRFAI